MKKICIFGSFIAVVLMMMLPSTCAIEANVAIESIESQHPLITPVIDFEKLIKKYKDNPFEPTIFILFFLTQIVRLLRIIKFTGILAIVLIILLILKSSGNTTSIIS